MKRKNIYSILCIGAILLISGCQKTPDDVKEKAQKHQKVEDVKETNLKYVSIDHILDNQEKVLRKAYQNLSFQNTVHLEQPDSVSILSLAITKSFGTKGKLADICAAFFGNDRYREKIIRMDDLPEFPYEGIFAFNYNSDDDHATVSDSGFFACSRKDSERFTENRQAVCHIDWNENMDDVYKIGEKQVSIREAVNYVNNWCNKNWILFEPEFTYQVKTVYVCKTKQKGYYYYFDVCKFYKGMPFDDIDFYMVGIDDLYSRNSLDVVMEHKNELSFFRNNNNSYDIVKEKTCNDKLIGLEQAVLLVQEKMSGAQKFEIADIDLKYVICSDMTEDEAAEAHTSNYAPGAPLTARPTWSFILDYQPSKEEEESYPWPRKFINVDMISGEILYRDSI